MATQSNQNSSKVVKYPYPSRFGSHASMVINDDLIDKNVTCQDEFGEYTTQADRLDNGLADPNRYAESRLSKLFEGRTKE